MSESCFQEFGLDARLTNGANSEFTMDNIFPYLHEHNPEDLKAQGGTILTLDTRLLPQNFLIEADSDSVNNESDLQQLEY